jgi:hypothetical protein
MGLRIAEEDIVRENEVGQSVVVVPKGQPIPEGFDSASTGLRQTEAATSGVTDATTQPPSSAPDYSELDVPALEEAVAERDLEVEGTGKDGNVVKADLIAALEADDQAKAS